MSRFGLITTSYPRHAGDPAGSFVAAHAAALRALGHEVEIVAAGGEEEAGFRLPASGFRLESSGAASRLESTRQPSVFRVPAGNLFYRGGAPELFERAPIAAAIDAARFLPRFVAAIRERAHRWDGAIAHWLAPSAIAALLATPRALPLLAIAHGGDVHLLRRARLLAPTIRALDRRGARIAYVSRALAALAPHTARSFVQPMGVDVDHFAALPRTPTTPPTIAVLARLVPIKGVDRAIDAFRTLRTPAQLVIAGDGPERAALTARAAADPRITFAGELPAPARDALLSRASILLIPSRELPNGRTEGTPLAALEALAAGIPIVGEPHGGLADLPIHPLHALETILTAPPPAPPPPPSWRTIAPLLTPTA